jgi:hypothetical protein
MRIQLPVALGGAAALVTAAAVVTLIPGGAQAATTASSTGASAYTACVRAHGVADFPGVTVTSDGRVLLNTSGSGVSFDPLSAAYQAAAKDCASKLPGAAALPAAPRLSRPSAPDVALTIDCSGSACPKAPSIQAPEPPS